MVLNFLIAVRHHETVPDWRPVRDAISQTAKSIAAQTTGEWRAVFVANTGTDMPEMPSGAEICRVDFERPMLPPSNNREEYYAAIRLDKGRRILAGLKKLKPSGHVMVVDYDDFVSSQLAAFVKENPESPGWFVDAGYLVQVPGRVALLKATGFNEVCGSSLIVSAEAYADLFRLEGSELEQRAARWLGSHKFIRTDLADSGTKLSRLPFPGAAWRLAGPGETSGSRTVYTELTRGTRNPITVLRRGVALRRISTKMRNEFFGG